MAIRVRPTTAACLLLFLAGCSVGDYEAKMLDAQNRVERFEEGNRLLEGPLAMPTRVEKGITIVDIDLFLRPPKGISTTASNEKSPRARLLYTFVASRQGGAGPFAYVEIAFVETKSKNAKDFEKSVIEVFSPTGQGTRGKRQVTPLGRPPMTYSTFEFDDAKYSYSINFIKGPINQLAIVYWINRASKGQATRAIEVSLASCALDSESHAVRKNQGTPLTVPQHPK